MTGVADYKPEQKTFIGEGVKYNQQGCCRKRPTRNCCLATGIIGGVILLIGLVVLVAGRSLILGAIMKTMPLAPGTDRLQSWLTPPVTPHLTGYGFHVTNPEEVLQGKKPVVEERGPFVYKAVTIKDSVDQDTKEENLKFNDDEETLTYRPRRFYFLDREQSNGDPDTTFLTVPNIPMLTGLHKVKNDEKWKKEVGEELMRNLGRGELFVNVSFTGLLWGYNDELPCNSLDRPAECGAAEGEVDIFAESDDQGWDEDEDAENVEYVEYEDEDWKRKKRSVGRYKREVDQEIDLKNMDFDSLLKAKIDFVDCKCEWGLFRDRNVTLRKSVRIHHGMADLSKKGSLVEFDSSPVMNWWKPGSQCDKLGGIDGGTMPPGILKDQSMDMFISLMCRRLDLVYEKEVEHSGIPGLRYIPPPNAMGSHDDPDEKARNVNNECYCLKDEGFSCFKSGVLNMAPCKRSEDLPLGAPIALSYPHFYQADPSFLDAVDGLSPDKEKHQFYVDVEPTYGFPLALRPRFQLNAIIQKDPDFNITRNMKDLLILPFLWAEDGFGKPSDEMAEALREGVEVPGKLSMLGGGLLLVIGGIMVAISLSWSFWAKRQEQNEKLDSVPLS